ncbi:ABC transporter permease [Sphingobacterium thalpophilum]|uniref:Macrolide transporter ATP-binding /permease protein n=1 Tax=Sphingobacterium thalpophilum TaxID=259 RepID=A0A4U9UWU0_9SPHI|nr:ABC transporter permease [Sphingobacterium thalpophilum]VTR34634.1 macrolide transporter ATP-binding /permease protein [Sphingobacterium thalpophilum]
MVNLRVILRAMLKRGTVSIVHVVGMSVSLATAILLFLTARFELSYDSFHEDAERIGWLYSKSYDENGARYNSSMAAPLAPALKEEIAGIEYISRMASGSILLKNGDRELVSTSRYVDDDFLSIFSFPLISGDKNALNDIGNIAIEENMARNLFGSVDVIGRMVSVNIDGTWEQKVISAVLGETPQNSSIRFSSLLRFELQPNYRTDRDNWTSQNHDVILKLRDRTVENIDFARETRAFTELHYRDEIVGRKNSGGSSEELGDLFSLNLISIKDYHLNSFGISGGPPSFYPWILLAVAGLILITACTNFVSLTLAGSLQRSREIGTRKILGATRKDLAVHLWLETFFVCFLSLIIGLFFAWLALSEYNSMLNYRLELSSLFSPETLIFFIGAFLSVTLLAGGYPAFKIARMSSNESLRGDVTIKSSRLRSGLTVLQFSITILFIISSIVVSSQIEYLATRSLGYNATEVISIPIGKGIDKGQALERMRAELSKETWIKSLSASDANLGLGSDGTLRSSILKFSQEDRDYSTNYMRVDYDFFKTLEIRLLAGRDFDRTMHTDTAAVIVNRKMAEQMGGIERILGKKIALNGGSTVIGVVDDFHFQHLRKKVEPLSLSINGNASDIEYIFIKVETDFLPKTMENIWAVWKKVNPNATNPASYLDENANNLYRKDRTFSKIVMIGSGIAIVISCMGLFALALSATARRVKEIGIRKVLGASVWSVIMLISSDFIKLVALAFAMSAPMAWILLNSWLQTYAYRVQMEWWMMGIAAVIVFLTTFFTIFWQTYRAATTNPVESLRI